MMFPTNTKDQRRLFLPRLLPLLLLLSLLPTTCWSFECFAASDGYVYPGAGTPTVDVDSVLGKAVRAYLDPNTTISQPVQEKYGTILNDWCVGDVVAMDSIFYYLSSFDEDIDNWNVSSVTTMRGMVSKPNKQKHVSVPIGRCVDAGEDVVCTVVHFFVSA